MTYKYFIGCSSIDEVKKKFKSTSKKLHPDVNPGKSDMEFKELNSEYQHISKNGVTYPIKNTTQYSNKQFRQPVYTQHTYYTREPKTKIVRVDPKNVPHKDFIDFMLRTIRARGYFESTLFFNYKTYIQSEGKSFHENDIKYIADLLEYADGWIHFTKKDLKI